VCDKRSASNHFLNGLLEGINLSGVMFGEAKFRNKCTSNCLNRGVQSRVCWLWFLTVRSFISEKDMFNREEEEALGKLLCIHEQRHALTGEKDGESGGPRALGHFGG
jgi:hypothetical protein